MKSVADVIVQAERLNAELLATDPRFDHQVTIVHADESVLVLRRAFRQDVGGYAIVFSEHHQPMVYSKTDILGAFEEPLLPVLRPPSDEWAERLRAIVRQLRKVIEPQDGLYVHYCLFPTGWDIPADCQWVDFEETPRVPDGWRAEKLEEVECPVCGFSPEKRSSWQDNLREDEKLLVGQTEQLDKLLMRLASERRQVSSMRADYLLAELSRQQQFDLDPELDDEELRELLSRVADIRPCNHEWAKDSMFEGLWIVGRCTKCGCVTPWEDLPLNAGTVAFEGDDLLPPD